ncbi:MAG: hypothetical protein ABSF85_10855 [Terriglobales bacterium]
MIASCPDINAAPSVAHGLRIEIGKGDAGHVAAALDAISPTRFAVANTHDASQVEQFRVDGQLGEVLQIGLR